MTLNLLQLFRDHADRLFPWLLLSAIVHLFILLGIGFQQRLPDKRPSQPEAIEIVLAPLPKAEKTPAQADLLSQANHQGRGAAGREPPARPPASPTPSAPEAQPPRRAEADTESSLRAQRQQAPAARPPAADAPPADTSTTSPALPLNPNLDIARLEQEMRRSGNRQPLREKVIDSSTREYRYAAYMEAWRLKVERIGNLNYPEEARAQGLAGSLVLDVALRPDGSIADIEVQRSSGSPVLDEAAKRIVRLGAPYSPFPEDMRREVDVLHIVRTWNFANNRLK
ncbi:energy transducer TonB [Thermithiobacillus tepidarius DSM 3134]|uniref:energy transducer TonB n=1 Tax=Thermithiobacillus tepidarius TaxID=929 RepID=UPI00041FA1F0|nr:energy transducer TonB [Thermithiobacillus tepidarius]